VRVLDQYTGKDVTTRLGAGRSFLWFWSAFKLFGWYDLVLTVAEDPAFEYRLAGHIENGRDSSTDPGMGGLGPRN
jgi:phospholipase C